jgi:hypothetical protein
VLSLRSFRILLTPLTYIPVGEAHLFAIDALRKLSTSYAIQNISRIYRLLQERRHRRESR